MVLTTPLIAYLAERGPVDVVSTPAAAALLANHPAVRDRVVYDKRGADRGVGGFRKLARMLRTRGYDAAYLAQGSMRSGALAVAAGVRTRVGFSSSAGRLFYTVHIAPIENMHHAGRLLALGTGDVQRAMSAEHLRPRLYPGEAERAAVDALLGPMDAPVFAVAPGSIWGTKRWPHFPALARALSRDGRVVVVGGEADRVLAQEISNATDGRALDATGRLSLLASAELIRRAAVLVTNDSAPLHLASAMNTPTVAVFGPTVPEFGFGPLADQRVVAGITLPCRPCDKHGPQRCPLGHWRCMREITADDVVALARGVISPRTV